MDRYEKENTSIPIFLTVDFILSKNRERGSTDGTGGEHFYHQLADEPDIHKTMDKFRNTKRSETLPDQWQSHILLRILMRSNVIYISEMPDDVIERMHMIPAHSIDEALNKAKQLLNKDDAKIVAIPDGIAVVVQK